MCRQANSQIDPKIHCQGTPELATQSTTDQPLHAPPINPMNDFWNIQVHTQQPAIPSMFCPMIAYSAHLTFCYFWIPTCGQFPSTEKLIPVIFEGGACASFGSGFCIWFGSIFGSRWDAQLIILGDDFETRFGYTLGFRLDALLNAFWGWILRFDFKGFLGFDRMLYWIHLRNRLWRSIWNYFWIR